MDVSQIPHTLSEYQLGKLETLVVPESLKAANNPPASRLQATNSIRREITSWNSLSV